MPCFSSKGKISLLVLAVYAAGSPNMGNCLARESNVPFVETSQNCTDHLPTFFWKDVPGRLLVLLVVHRIQRIERPTVDLLIGGFRQSYLES